MPKIQLQTSLAIFNWDRTPRDSHITYRDYIPNAESKYSFLTSNSTSLTSPIEYLSPKAFVNAEADLNAKEKILPGLSNTVTR